MFLTFSANCIKNISSSFTIVYQKSLIHVCSQAINLLKLERYHAGYSEAEVIALQ